MSVDLALGALEFEAPLVNPSQTGLYAAVTWVQDGGDTARFLGEGVRIRPHNYGAEGSVGLWDSPWCGAPGSGSGEGEIKWGVRPGIPEPFIAATIWAYDQCDPTPGSRAEIRIRVAQNLRMLESAVAEVVLAERMLADAGVPVAKTDLRDCVSYLEGKLAATGTLGLIHADPQLAAQEFGLFIGTYPNYRTPLGHSWVTGGGYVDTLGNTLIATSPLYGWRTSVAVREAFESTTDTYIAIAERSLVVGYEQLIAAAAFT